MEDDIRAEGAEIIWVLEQNRALLPGTPEDCKEFMLDEGATTGWCVGDAQTRPESGSWDDSPFSEGRGFDILVPRSTMEIVYSTSHGTPAGNENPSGEDVLAVLRDLVGDLE